MLFVFKVGIMRKIILSIVILCIFLSIDVLSQPQQTPAARPTVTGGRGGGLNYQTDEKGNRIPDFSHCGYMGQNKPVPDVPVRVVVSPLDLELLVYVVDIDPRVIQVVDRENL